MDINYWLSVRHPPLSDWDSFAGGLHFQTPWSHTHIHTTGESFMYIISHVNDCQVSFLQ